MRDNHAGSVYYITLIMYKYIYIVGIGILSVFRGFNVTMEYWFMYSACWLITYVRYELRQPRFPVSASGGMKALLRWPIYL